MSQFGSKGEVELVDYDYSKKESVNKGTVSLWLLSKSLKAEDLVYLLDNWLNGKCGSPFPTGVKMGKLFMETHRTLQGMIVNLCLGILCGLAETDSRWTDPRNEKAITLAKLVKGVVDEHGTQMLI